jgi:hypothetical protein
VMRAGPGRAQRAGARQGVKDDLDASIAHRSLHDADDSAIRLEARRGQGRPPGRLSGSRLDARRPVGVERTARSTSRSTGAWAPRWCRSAAGTCPSAYPDSARSPSTSPAATAPSPSTSPTSARSGSRAPTPSSASSGRSPTTSPRSVPGRAQYTHLLDEHDASVLDDIIVWWVDDDRFDVMPNASNTDRVVEAADRAALVDVSTVDVTAGRCSPSRVPRPPAPGSRGLPEAAAVGRFRVAAAALLERHRAASSPAPATPARTASRSPSRRARRRALGRRARGRRRARRPVWAPATPCASRPACRCTVTSWVRDHPAPGRPRLGGGWDKDDFRGTGRRWRPSGPPGASPPAAGGRTETRRAVRKRSARSGPVPGR